MEFDQENGMITASYRKDSTGKAIAFPAYNHGDFKSVSDTIRFNMKTGKGMTKGTYTQQGEMYIYGEKIKKVSPDIFYAYKGRFTTCDLDTPHFAFVSNKIKFINKKVAITGPVHPEFEGVPIHTFAESNIPVIAPNGDSSNERPRLPSVNPSLYLMPGIAATHIPNKRLLVAKRNPTASAALFFIKEDIFLIIFSVSVLVSR
ncbi:MAG: hypothetical protein WDM71_08995 [Ferruginibacter sp.]